MSDENETPSGPLSELLHELSVGLFKTHLLLSEAGDAEWRTVAGRLATLKELVAGFPTTPRARRTLGFAAPTKKPRRR